MRAIKEYKLMHPKCLICLKRLSKISKRGYINFACTKCVSLDESRILDSKFKFQVKVFKSKNKKRQLYSITRRLDKYKILYKNDNCILLEYDNDNYPWFVSQFPPKLFIEILKMNECQILQKIKKLLMFI